jgi:glutamate/tyrosine decarboxylase-like PLP-dependent enzyme
MLALNEKIQEKKQINPSVKILAIVGVAGTTETGSIDDLKSLSEIALREQAWFHVDAAWGAPLLFSEQFRLKMQGIEKANSVTLDGHKLFYLPMSHGCVLFKDPKHLDLLKHSAQYIIRKGSVDLGRTTLEGSRRFESLKMWFFLKTFGYSGYQKLIERSVNLTLEFSRLVQRSPEFELCSEPESNIVTYRFLPPKFRDKKQLGHFFNEEETRLVNKINVEVQKQQRNNGKSFVSRTMLESLNSSVFSSVVLRVVLFNPLTTIEILTAILKEQKELGELL